MESYIIRVYRFEQHTRIAGTVQHVENPDKYTFSSIDELWKILQGVQSDKPMLYEASPAQGSAFI